MPGTYERTDEHRRQISEAKRGNTYNVGKRGAAHSAFKTGRAKHSKGYYKVLVQQGHPFFEMAFRSGRVSYYILEHRLVMAQHIGRPLTSEEVVHHIDDDPSNNEISNLMLFANKGEHTAHHNLLD